MRNGIDSQMSLLSMLDIVPDVGMGVASHFPEIGREQEAEALSEYLYQGERISSLLREQKEAGQARYKPCNFLEKFRAASCLDMKSEHYVRQAAVKAAREMWERNDSADIPSNALLQYLSKYLIVEAETVGENEDEVKRLMDFLARGSGKEGKGTIMIRSYFRKAPYDYHVPAGAASSLPKNRHGAVYRLRGGVRCFRVADAGLLFWKALLACVLKEQVLAAVVGLSEKERSDNMIYCYLTEYQGKDRENAPESGNAYRDGNLSFWFMSGEEDSRLPFEFFDDVGMDVLCGLLEKVYDVYGMEKQAYEVMNGLKGESAKVYQTKKNISLKCQKAMQSSSFHKYFGYVEIDDECDLDKFSVVEGQFKALSELIFGGKKYEKVSIRFRKLGRHHALGLYYPSIRCLAVDVRNTDSLSHEYFHMLDHENGRVSSGYSFLKVRERYKECVIREMEKPENRDLRTRMRGKSKRNLSYYLAPTEIFARCGEIYLTKVRKVSNSLVKPDKKESFAYPDDEQLLELIAQFYGGFLQAI